MTEHARWLVLMYQFPAGPDSRRVRLWRRLQSVGAVAIKHSVYVLPFSEQSEEDFQWVLTELRAAGAEAALLESRFVDGMDDRQMQDLFRAARNADYRELLDELEGASAGLQNAGDDATAGDNARRILARARKRIAEIGAIDFFDADGRAAVESAMLDLTARTNEQAGASGTADAGKDARLQGLRGRVWVTRRGVRVDRIASAWLIRGRIDPDAKFRFVDATGYEPLENELRFDMFEAEFTHEGDLCTFEVLSRLVDEQDRALRCIAEIVHDIDLKDGKFGRPETEGVGNLLTGIVAGTDDDEERIERGGAMFDDLYRFFSGSVA